MFNKRIFVIMLSSLIALFSQFVFATQAANVTCPTSDQIKQYSSLFSAPYGFNNKSKSLKSVTVATDFTEMNEETRAGWFLVVYPLEVNQAELAPQVLKNTLDNLIPVSSVPFNFMAIDDVEFTVCAYTLPGNQELNALAYYVDETDADDDFDDDDFEDDQITMKKHLKHHHKHIRILKIAKHMLIAKQIKQFIH